MSTYQNIQENIDNGETSDKYIIYNKIDAFPAAFPIHLFGKNLFHIRYKGANEQQQLCKWENEKTLQNIVLELIYCEAIKTWVKLLLINNLSINHLTVSTPLVPLQFEQNEKINNFTSISSVS